jgi:hypothetical protein
VRHACTAGIQAVAALAIGAIAVQKFCSQFSPEFLQHAPVLASERNTRKVLINL